MKTPVFALFVYAIVLAACGDDSSNSPIIAPDVQNDVTNDASGDAPESDADAGDLDGSEDATADTDTDDDTSDDTGERDADTGDAEAGDTDDDTTDTSGELTATFVVDDTLVPERASHPALDGGDERPVARFEDSEGRGAEFVENELIVATSDTDGLNALLERWDGEVIADVTPDSDALPGLPTIYLVRIDTPTDEVDALAESLGELGMQGAGEYSVSSEAGLALIATATAEASPERDGGMQVGLNWIGQSDAQFIDGVSNEAANGRDLDGYSRNAFNWPHLADGSTQDFGVTGAWRDIELAGRLENRVDVAILDMGYELGGDLGPGFEFSNVPFILDIDGQSSLGSCGGGSCDWHGTNVAVAAFGLPDNGDGAAGPAGPIANPMYVYTYYDFFTSISAIVVASAAGADVLNMSYGAPVPGVLGFSVWPFELTTLIAREAGVLIFASAGNAGIDVDDENCFLGICWEHTWHTPCENAGVICVGGLGRDSIARAGNSNFGEEHVDIYGPYTVWVGPDPDNVADEARSINGTSFSSPFVAGAAALIWAADPSASADDVEARLSEFARTDSPSAEVARYVNVRDAVRDALGGPFSPFVEIEAPSEGSSFNGGLPGVTFRGVADDYEDGPLELTWTSDVDGELGVGSPLTISTLSPGPHVIRANAIDSDRTRTTRVVRLTINNTRPVVDIVAPDTGARFFFGEDVAFRGSSFDPNELGNSLTDGDMSWSSDLDGTLGTGINLTFSALSEGAHTITLTGTDSGGATGTDSIGLTIDAPPVDLPPRVIITSPADDSEFFWDGFDDGAGAFYYDIQLTATASDDEDGTLTDINWSTDATEWQPAFLGNGTTLDTRLFGDCFGTTHTLRATVTDSGGNTRSATISILIFTLC